jgi:hypothetical protein
MRKNDDRHLDGRPQRGGRAWEWGRGLRGSRRGGCRRPGRRHRRPPPPRTLLLAAGAACFGAVSFLKEPLRLDDSLDACGVHGVGGVFGALLTGVLATVAANAGGADGLLHDGGLAPLGKQVLAVGATALYAFLVTWGVLVATDKLVVGLRVAERVEDEGLDVHEHGEVAYYVPYGFGEAARPADPSLALGATGVVLPKK